MDLTRRYGDRERGSASVEYAGVIILVVAIIGVLLVSGLGSTVSTALGCAVRSVGTQAGTCGGPDVPTTYDADGDGVGAPGSLPTRIDDGSGGGSDDGGTQYDNASSTTDTVDQDKVDDALDEIRDALDGGFFGVRGGDLDDAKDALAGLDGAEVDAVIADMSDDELRHWINELEDGWVGGGWDREQRRELWELIVSKASKSTLDRLAGLTDEIQPSFDDVGGDDARDNPTSPSNVAEYGELEHELFVGAVRPTDVSQGQIGDCWYMMSMMAVAQADPSVIRDAITLNANGTYTVRLYPDGDAVDVTVTPEMVLMPDGSPAFAANDGGDAPYELWPMVLEKALALQYGDYEDIEGGWPGDGMTLLTGRPSESHDSDDLGIDSLADVLADGGAIGLSSLTKDDAKKSPYYQSDKGDERLYANHAYYVQSVDVSKGTVTLVNPWGIAGHPPITMDYDDYVSAFRQVDTNEVS